MAEDSASSPMEKRRASGCWRGLVILFLSVFLIGGVVLWKFADLAKGSLTWLSDLPARMTSQQITESFRQSITEIVSTKGDVLEVATMQTDETITKYDMKTLFNDTVYLGTTVSEIRTPVVYRYHIQLSDEWQLRVEEGQCIVQAPALRPSLPPAIRTEGLEKKSEAGWLRFNAVENMTALEKSLTPTLEKRAGNKQHLDLVREAARKSVAEFVQKWLLKEGQAASAGIRSITVIFPDEAKPAGEPLTLPPTVKLP